jgi:hypothetical protein
MFKIVHRQLRADTEVYDLYKLSPHPCFVRWVNLLPKWDFIQRFSDKKEAEHHIQLIKDYPRDAGTSYYYPSGNEDYTWWC